MPDSLPSDSVGLVSPKTIHFDKPLELACGQTLESYDLVVNTTRLGLDPDDPSPLDLGILDRVGSVVDVVYGSGSTAFLEQAREMGIRGANGSEMLLHQGAVAFERWWGVSPSLDAMRQALGNRKAVDQGTPPSPGDRRPLPSQRVSGVWGTDSP